MHAAAFARYSTRQDTDARSDRARARRRAARTTYTVDSLPEALPCHKFDDLFSEDADVWGNVLINDEAEFQQLAPLTKAISREEAEEKGCCIIYRPTASKAAKKAEDAAAVAQPQFFSLPATDDTVYGRAAYLSSLTTAFVTSSAEKAKTPVP